MATLDEKHRTLKQCKKFMEELCDPGKTPRVPGSVRDRARTILKSFPNENEEYIASSKVSI